MFKPHMLSALAISASLFAGGLVNIDAAKAAPPCPPGAECMPGGGGMKPHGAKPSWPPKGDQQGDWKHRRHHGNAGPNFGVGIYLGDGYDGYDRRYHRRFVSCGEAKGIVRANGFRNVRTQSCAPGNYRFLGTKRGSLFAVVVSGRGRIIAVNRW